MSPQTISYTVVDAFTSSPFQGNPAAVIVIDPQSSNAFNDVLLQKIAREFNLSETAFVAPAQDAAGTFDLRWFTPTTEVELCGHATLASARVLFGDTTGLVGPDVELLTFRTRSGDLTAKRIAGPDSSEKGVVSNHIELEFPAIPFKEANAAVTERTKAAFLKAFGVEGIKVVKVCVVDGKAYDGWGLIEIDDSFDLEHAKVLDASPFKELVADSISAIIVTSSRRSVQNPQAAFISRIFAPTMGISEDPVTGSAHCFLAPYWSERLNIPKGQVTHARQVSPRGGDVDVVFDQDRGIVKLRGDSVIVHKGQLYYQL